jgi:hypothetical protein
LDGFKEDIREKYGDVSKREGFEDKYQEDTEKALTTTGGFKKKAVKGDCRVCGKKGHKGTPLSTRAPTSVAMVVETIPVRSGGTAIKRVTRRKHVSKKKDEGSSNPESAEIMLISANFVKCNSPGSAENNDKKLEEDLFDYIPGTD